MNSKLTIMASMLVITLGCATFGDTAVTSMNATKTALDTTSSAYLRAVETMFKADLLDHSDVPTLQVIVEAYDDAYRLWAFASDAYFAGKQDTFLNTAACLLVSLRTILDGLKEANILISNNIITVAIKAGEALLAEYGGVCK